MWSEWQTVVNVTVAFVNRQGVYRGAAAALRAERQQRTPGRRIDGVRGGAGQACPSGRTLAGKYGGVGILLWAIQALGEAAGAGRLYELATGVWGLAGPNHHPGGRGSHATQWYPTDLRVVQGAFGPDSVRSRQDGLCGQRNKTRMKQYRGLSSAQDWGGGWSL